MCDKRFEAQGVGVTLLSSPQERMQSEEHKSGGQFPLDHFKTRGFRLPGTARSCLCCSFVKSCHVPRAVLLKAPGRVERAALVHGRREHTQKPSGPGQHQEEAMWGGCAVRAEASFHAPTPERK